MRKICTFTQTYSNDRGILFQLHDRDYLDTSLRNDLGATVYSFHNTSDEVIDNIKRSAYLSRLSRLCILKYDNISYPQSFKQTLEFIQAQGFDTLMFLQDDVFSHGRVVYDGELNYDSVDFSPLLEYIKNGDYKMLNLEHYPLSVKTTPDRVIHKQGEFEVYNTTSTDYQQAGFFSFDDGPYVASIDFLLAHIYDEVYFNTPDIWVGESYLNQKISRHPISRYSTNMPMWHRSRIVGRYAHGREKDLADHIKLFAK